MTKNKPLLIIGGLVAVIACIAVAGIGWWLGSPLFLDNEVAEEFPFEMPSEEEIAAMTDEEKAAAEAELVEASADMPDTEMEEDMPEPETEAETAEDWVATKTGTFAGKGGTYQGSGTATIYEMGAERFLRFDPFEVTNGPALHVLLVANPDGTTQDDFGDYVDLGELKGNIGAQNYEIPADLDLSLYNGVIIYCMPFHVTFSSASFGG